MSDSPLIRDYINTEIIHQISKSIHALWVDFDLQAFVNDATDNLEALTYSERKNQLTDALIGHLPKDYVHATDLLLAILPPPYSALDSDEKIATIGRFYIVSFTGYISKAGIEHLERSMEVLKIMTQSFTSEWDIRPFIIKYPKESWALLDQWTTSNSHHVRRLVSEGSRPNLPWGKKLKTVAENPEGTSLPLLEKLYRDSSEYVRRSVANHLNDITKHHPSLVIATLKRWMSNDSSEETRRLVNHALRSLIKTGNSEALSLVGYGTDHKLKADIELEQIEVLFGAVLKFSVQITNVDNAACPLMLDFVLGFQKKNGTIAEKVFKLRKITLHSKDHLSIDKSFSFRAISTRTYYPGLHTIELQINGKRFAKKQFMLLDKNK